MPDLSPVTRERVAEVAGRHGFSAAAAEVMLAAVARGRGAMAQFDHPEFGGPGQWMRGGMTMVGDMFNSALKARVEALCADLAGIFDSEPVPARAAGASAPTSAEAAAPGGAWWPAGLPAPESTGAQNDVRYAWFAAARRLAIERGGRVTLYDTLDHRIAGFAQQQSGSSTLSFTSQHGAVDVARLPVVDAHGVGDAKGAGDTKGAGDAKGPAHDVITAIERLAELHARGILSDAEFAAKKAELLGRI